LFRSIRITPERVHKYINLGTHLPEFIVAAVSLSFRKNTLGNKPDRMFHAEERSCEGTREYHCQQEGESDHAYTRIDEGGDDFACISLCFFNVHLGNKGDVGSVDEPCRLKNRLSGVVFTFLRYGLSFKNRLERNYKRIVGF